MRAVSGATRASIVDAGARCIIRDGLAHATMSAIAAECGVSKALLHYHFANRAQLLTEAANLFGRRLVTRERRALEHADAATAIDRLWQWLAREMERGELRALLELGSTREPVVREATEHIDGDRHAAALQTVVTLFGLLDLTPRVPASSIATAAVTFMNGLSLGVSGGETRTSFDVFWLAMLSLGD